MVVGIKPFGHFQRRNTVTRKFVTMITTATTVGYSLLYAGFAATCQREFGVEV